MASLWVLASPSIADTLYFDASGSVGQPGSGNGGSGSFNTSPFTNGATNVDQLFVDGDASVFQGTPGTVTVDAPVTTSNLTINFGPTANETFGAPGTTNTITIPLGGGGAQPITVYGAGNLTFNAPLDFDMTAAPLYAIYWNNNVSGTTTFNNLTFSGVGNTYPGDYRLSGNFVFNGAVANTTTGETADPGVTFGTGTSTLTSTASFSGVYIGINGGTVYSQTAALGTDNLNIGSGAFLTAAPNLTITNGIQSGGSYTVGSNEYGNTTYSGTFSSYNTAALNLTAGTGAEVHITTNGIYVAGNNTITINDPTQAINAGDISNPGVVSLESLLFSNGNAETSLDYYAKSSNATVNIANGTLLVNAGTRSDPVVAASINISSATPGTPGSDSTPAVPPTYTGTLGGTGVVGFFNQYTRDPVNGPFAGTYITPVIAEGPLSTIAPGNMTMVAATTPGGAPTFVSQVGTLTLAGGLTATNGLTMNFTLNGTSANSELNVANGPVTLGGVLTFNFTNIGGALSTSTPYTLVYSDPNAAPFTVDYDTAELVVNGPTGYTADVEFDVEGNRQVIDVTFSSAAVPEPSTFALMGLGGVVMAWRLRRIRVGALS